MIVSTLFKDRVSYRQLTFIIETFELMLMKSCAKVDLFFVNIQCASACSTLNFKVQLLFCMLNVIIIRLFANKKHKFNMK